LAAKGSTDEGAELIEHGLHRFREAGATLNEAYYLGMHAEALVLGDQPAEGAALIDHAMSISTSRGYFYEAELWRVRARCSSASEEHGLTAARDALDTGADIARRQGAIALELRVVTDRVELEDAHGDAAPWRSRLAELVSVYDGQRPVPWVLRAQSLLDA